MGRFNCFTGVLADDFELLPDVGGIVVRRKGSNARLVATGALWAPYVQDLTCHWSSSLSMLLNMCNVQLQRPIFCRGLCHVSQALFTGALLCRTGLLEAWVCMSECRIKTQKHARTYNETA